MLLGAAHAQRKTITGQYRRSAWSDSTDILDMFLYGQAVKFVERQRSERADSIGQYAQGLAKGSHLFDIAARDGSRIRHAPMRGDGMTGPHRAYFAGRVITDCENEIHHRRIAPRKFIPAFGTVAPRSQACLLQCAQCERIYFSFWKTSRGISAKASLAFEVQQTFGED